MEQLQNDPLDLFVAGIIKDKSLPIVDDEVRKQLERDLKARLVDEINRALLHALPSERLDELERIAGADVDQSAIQKVIKDSGINVKKVTLETMLRFRDLYLGSQSTQGQ